MSLARITEGDGIDYDLINVLIDRLNQLEQANNLQALWTWDTASSAYSMTDRVIIQAGSVVLSESSPGSNWAWKDVYFPRRFAAVPAVVHMPVQRPGWSNQVSVMGLTEAYFTPVVQQPSNNFGAAIGPVRISWIAVGPVASF